MAAATLPRSAVHDPARLRERRGGGSAPRATALPARRPRRHRNRPRPPLHAPRAAASSARKTADRTRIATSLGRMLNASAARRCPADPAAQPPGAVDRELGRGRTGGGRLQAAIASPNESTRAACRRASAAARVLGGGPHAQQSGRRCSATRAERLPTSLRGAGGLVHLRRLASRHRMRFGRAKRGGSRQTTLPQLSSSDLSSSPQFCFHQLAKPAGLPGWRVSIAA